MKTLVAATLAMVALGAAPAPGSTTAPAPCPATYETSARWAGVVPNTFASRVAVRGTWAWAACDVRGLRTIDVSDPGMPVLRSTFIRNEVVDVAVGGDFALVVQNHWNGVRNCYLDVLYIENPATPSFTAEFYLSSHYARRVAMNGDHGYVLIENGDVVPIDLTDPWSPVPGSAHPLGAQDFAFDGNVAYVACGLNGTKVLDLTDPMHPVVVNTIPGAPNALTCANGLVFTGGVKSTLDIIDPQAGAGSPLLSRTNVWPYKGFSPFVFDVEVSGNLAYVSLSQIGTVVLDVSNPRAPRVLGNLDTGAAFGDQEIDGGVLVVGDSYSLFQVWRLGDGTPSVPCGRLATPVSTEEPYTFLTPVGDHAVWCNQLLVENDTTYVSVTRFFDLSDPSAPRQTGMMEKPVRYAATRGDLLVGGLLQFYTMDVSVPTRPTVLGAITPPGYVWGDCVLAGDLAWTGYRDVTEGVRAFDISDPAHPSILGQTMLGPGQLNSLAIHGDRLYAGLTTDYNAGAIVVVDISNPSAPSVVRRLATSNRAVDLAVDGDSLWVLVYPGTVELRSLADPDVPVTVGSRMLVGFGQGVEARGGLAYVTATGVHVLDGTTPNLDCRGSMEVPGATAEGGARIVGDFLVAAFRGGIGATGLVVYPLHPGTPRAPLGAPFADPAVFAGVPGEAVCSLAVGSRNPFGDALALDVAMPTGGPARLTVFDAAGRLVRALRDRPLTAGRHRVTWDGRDDAGQAVADGVYFVRLQSRDGTSLRKVVRLR